MLLEVLQNYMDAVNGATRLTQRNATAMARNILIQAGMEPAADIVHQLSEQLIAAQEAQYAMMRQMIQAEVSATMERMGAASRAMGYGSSSGAPVIDTPAAPAVEAAPEPEPEVESDRPRQEDLMKEQLAKPKDEPAEEPVAAKSAPASKATKTAPAKKAPAAKKATAAKAAPAKKTTAKSTASKSAASKTTASKTTASKTAASKAAPSKTTARKTTAQPRKTAEGDGTSSS